MFDEDILQKGKYESVVVTPVGLANIAYGLITTVAMPAVPVVIGTYVLFLNIAKASKVYLGQQDMSTGSNMESTNL